MSEKASRSTYLDVGSRLEERNRTASAENPAESTPLPPDIIPSQATTDNSGSPDTLAASPTSPDGRLSPEAASAANSETLYTDIEILGNRYPIRQMIREAGNQRMRAVESATATWKNMLDTPGKMRLGLARSIAEKNLNRQREKTNAVSHLSDRNWLKRRRMSKLLKAQERFQKADAKYQGRKDRMAARKEHVGNNVEQRRAAYRKELRARREAALGRRALRRELRAQDAGRFEALSVLKDIPKEHLERVGKLAAVAYVSEKQATQASKNEATHLRREKQAENAIDKNRKRAAEVTREADRASGIVEELTTQALPNAEESLESLKSELAELDDNSPERTKIEEKIQATEDRIAIHKREIDYWKQVADSNRERAATLDEKHDTLFTNLELNQLGTQTVAADAEAARRTARAHADTLTKAAEEATNSAPEETSN